ncbi:hypothetical protein EVG20_g8515 [Dentipellis fragilis]|uniref:Uncharacterized protein n=1 Tax=Dentipellis fragilis TaxID=205917 RepID=A0A4Y9Y7W7_9AGAM|nr:hypothetical protein EVG20_g8515 [Dentipellis fragilis]
MTEEDGVSASGQVIPDILKTWTPQIPFLNVKRRTYSQVVNEAANQDEIEHSASSRGYDTLYALMHKPSGAYSRPLTHAHISAHQNQAALARLQSLDVQGAGLDEALLRPYCQRTALSHAKMKTAEKEEAPAAWRWDSATRVGMESEDSKCDLWRPGINPHSPPSTLLGPHILHILDKRELEDDEGRLEEVELVTRNRASTPSKNVADREFHGLLHAALSSSLWTPWSQSSDPRENGQPRAPWSALSPSRTDIVHITTARPEIEKRARALRRRATDCGRLVLWLTFWRRDCWVGSWRMRFARQDRKVYRPLSGSHSFLAHHRLAKKAMPHLLPMLAMKEMKGCRWHLRSAEQQPKPPSLRKVVDGSKIRLSRYRCDFPIRKYVATIATPLGWMAEPSRSGKVQTYFVMHQRVHEHLIHLSPNHTSSAFFDAVVVTSTREPRLNFL